MSVAFWLQGLLIGFSIAAPVGAIGVLCIRRTLADGRVVGLVSGLGAATADALYGCVAGFGVTAISNFLVSQQVALRLFGGLFLCYLGVKTFLSRPSSRAATALGGGLARAYGSTFVLTLANPMTILSFAAIFAGLGLGNTGGSYGAAAWLVAGVFMGSAAWWLLLSSGVGLLRGRLGVDGLQWINRISGVIIAGFGVAALWSI